MPATELGGAAVAQSLQMSFKMYFTVKQYPLNLFGAVGVIAGSWLLFSCDPLVPYSTSIHTDMSFVKKDNTVSECDCNSPVYLPNQTNIKILFNTSPHYNDKLAYV